MAAWLAWREGGQLGRVLAARRVAVWVGLSDGRKLCWFTAFTLQNAAYVNASGRSSWSFRCWPRWWSSAKRLTPREGLGSASCPLSILGLVLLI